MNVKASLLLCAVALLAGLACGQDDESRPEPDPAVEVREGYSLSIARDELSQARFMEFGPEGELYVSLPRQGQIKTCRDRDGDGYFESVATFVEDHRTAHGMQWHDGWLYFTVTGEILRARDTDGDGRADEQQTVIRPDELPSGGGHWWRSILIHNGRIYTSIGDRGNISIPEGERQKIWSFNLDGSDKKLFASGLRNTEKLVVRPETDEIWGMDHGSDHFGRQLERQASGDAQPITDLNPPDEMNHYVQGGFYGHPFVVGNKLPRYEYMDRDDIVELAEKTIPPAWPTGGHWAPNAMEFYTGEQFPAEHRGDAFVAYHGSWNREEKAGYCVTRVLFEKGKPYGELKYLNFLTEDGRVLGRPVDVVVAPDGSLLISDDHGGRIYRLRYVGDRQAGGEAERQPRPAQRPEATAPPSPRQLTQLKLGPLTTFDQACARCHGPQGAFYGEAFAQLSDEELHEMVEEMMEGPGGLDPSEDEIEAMTAYHHALSADEPFLVVTQYDPEENVLAGEASPGAVVGTGTGPDANTVEVAQDGTWRLESLDTPVRLWARRDGETTTLLFPRAQWTHANQQTD